MRNLGLPFLLYSERWVKGRRFLPKSERLAGMISSSQHNTTWHRDTDIQSVSYFMA